MKTFSMLQYTPEWWQVRRGVPTCSEFDRILTPGGKPSGQQVKYIAKLIGDTICLNPNFFTERPMSRAIANGIDMEPEARRWYEFERDVKVRQVGFCLSDCGRFGGSPDGLVGDDGGLELKCPLAETQVGYLLDGAVLPAEYRPQVHGLLLVSGRPWWDFVSYAPGCPPLLVRVTPDEYTKLLREELMRFLDRYEGAKEQLKKGVTP